MTLVDRVRHPNLYLWVQTAGAILLIGFTPLWLGGALPITQAAVVAVVAALLAVEWLPRILEGRGPDRFERAWIRVWCVVSILLAFQLVPLPTFLLERLGAHPAAFSELTDRSLLRLSPTPLATRGYWAIFTAYWALGAIVARLPRRWLKVLVVTFVVLASCEALYGLLALAHGAGTILGLAPRTAYLGDATGSFVNRNHFAGLLALCWPIGLAWWLRPSERRPGALPVRVAAAGLFSLLMGAAIVASHSRLGLLASLMGLATWCWLSRSRMDGSQVSPVAIRAVWGAALVGALWFGSGVVIERFRTISLASERFQVWQALLELPGRTWWLGAGAGSFSDVFKTVQPFSVRASYEHAHADILEFVLEFGIVGSALIFWAAWHWWRRVKPHRLSSLQKGALAGMAAIALHSLGDFDLRLPGVALAFWGSVGILTNRELGSAPRLRGSTAAPALTPSEPGAMP